MTPTSMVWTFAGSQGEVHAQSWRGEAAPTHVVILVHGYGEHIGRYGHVATALVEAGAVVYGMDHMGHGKSEGPRAIVTDFDDVVADVHAVVKRAMDQHLGLPLAMIGHSMGGLIATRYAQTHGEQMAALVLSGPAIGRSDGLEALLAMDPLPSTPLDPAVLSRDDSVGAAYAEDPLVWHGPFQRPMLEAMLRANRQVSSTGRVKGAEGADLPLLWQHGADDQLVPVEASRSGFDAIRGAKSSTIHYPGARHEIFNETNRAEVLSDTVRFITTELGELASA